MKRLLTTLGLAFAAVGRSSGQSLDDLNIQLHRYSTQGGFNTDRNSWNTTDPGNAGAAWSGLLVNLGPQPERDHRFTLLNGTKGRALSATSVGKLRRKASKFWLSGN